MTREVTSDEEAEIQLLSSANHRGKFAIELGHVLPPAQQIAFERGIDNQWFTLVDVAPLAVTPDRLTRVFRLTEAGWHRLDHLLSRKGISNLGEPT